MPTISYDKAEILREPVGPNVWSIILDAVITGATGAYDYWGASAGFHRFVYLNSRDPLVCLCAIIKIRMAGGHRSVNVGDGITGKKTVRHQESAMWNVSRYLSLFWNMSRWQRWTKQCRFSFYLFVILIIVIYYFDCLFFSFFFFIVNSVRFLDRHSQCNIITLKLIYCQTDFKNAKR